MNTEEAHECNTKVHDSRSSRTELKIPADLINSNPWVEAWVRIYGRMYARTPVYTDDRLYKVALVDGLGRVG